MIKDALLALWIAMVCFWIPMNPYLWFTAWALVLAVMVTLPLTEEEVEE